MILKSSFLRIGISSLSREALISSNTAFIGLMPFIRSTTASHKLHQAKKGERPSQAFSFRHLRAFHCLSCYLLRIGFAKANGFVILPHYNFHMLDHSIMLIHREWDRESEKGINAILYAQKRQSKSSSVR